MRSWLSLLAFALLPFAPARGQFQQACFEVQHFEVFVDPNFGLNATGQVGQPGFPFQTINAAITAAVASPQYVAQNQCVVRLMPGIYSAATNGETFPIVIKNRINVWGTGAKECVIVGDGTQTMSAFYPRFFFGMTPVTKEVLFDFSTARSGASLQRVTLSGGHVQVYAYAARSQSSVVANCVFDLRANEEEAPIAPPDFGILTIARWDNGSLSYPDVNWNILNNTFIQGRVHHHDGFDTFESALPSNVGICSVNDPRVSSGVGDPNTQLRGLCQHSIQNNLLRALPIGIFGFAPVPFLGVDSTDTDVSYGSVTGATNAFDATQLAATDPTFTFESNLLPGQIFPFPKVQVNGPIGQNDPGFVGEMVSKQYFTQLTYTQDLRDWRLLPTSIMINQGSHPIAYPAGDPCNLRLQAVNGVAYSDIKGQTVTCFQWDMDGHGNQRVAREVDLGADEASTVVDSGNYGNDTKGHLFNNWAVPPLPIGNDLRVFIVPSGNQTMVQYFTMPTSPVGLPAWLIPPGTTYGAPTGQGLLYLDASILPGNTFTSVTTTWFNIVDGATHTFGAVAGLDLSDPTQYFNQQFLFGITAPAWTNLLSEIY